MSAEGVDFGEIFFISDYYQALQRWLDGGLGTLPWRPEEGVERGIE